MFFKAQELATAFPEIVDEPKGPQARDADYVPEKLGDPNGWGVMYDRCGAVALQAIKELLARVVALEGGASARADPTSRNVTVNTVNVQPTRSPPPRNGRKK